MRGSMPKLNFLVRAAVCFLLIFLPLNTLDQWFYDHFFRLRGTQHHATSFILIHVNDAKLYQEFSQGLTRAADPFGLESRSIWYSNYYQQLLEQVETDRPRLVVFTSYYEKIEGMGPLPGKAYSNLVFAGALNRENKLVPPLPALTQGDNYGFSNIFPEPDNVVRRSHLVYSSSPSLALSVYHRLNTEPIKRNLLDSQWIDFRGPAGSYPTLDATELLEGKVPAGFLRDKVVLIGRESSPQLHFDTPFGPMSRLEIQANTLDSLNGHRDLRLYPRIVTLLIASLAVLASILIILLFPLTVAWLFLLLLSVLTLLLALFCLAELKVWAGVANPIFCIFGTHLLMLGYKLSKQEEQQWKLQQESEYLKELDQFKNNFISLFSHDLKTPIAKIKAITDRLITDNANLPPDVKDSLKAIERTNSELARSISDILKVTKMESMSLEPVREVIDLNRLVEIAVGRLKFQADEKKIAIVMDLEPLFSMEGDQQLLQEVITNLLENAIKYSHSSTTVVVRTREEDRFVRVSVVDQGVGIPADELPRVTGKFYRGRSVAEKVKGSGLGLYLAKYFVELHQGRLELKSEVGQGTEVSFLLPITG